ncbi:MAG: hypothetical protein AMS16_06000 [Planctomycetes bacterium DG_58]|nr:MAG: hypothetical protein AMS16_06000 [Planctomycetes bacterium DG_58]
MRKLTAVLGTLVWMVAAHAAWSVSAAFFEVATTEEFDKGKLDDAVVVEPGRLTLAHEKKELLKAEGEIVWTLVRDRTGAVYAGTSHKGKVYVIRNEKASEAGTVEDAAVFAVAVAPDGKVYFGGSPSGTVYRDGKVFCKTGQSYIWSMLFDEGGVLYAATGPDGKLLRIDHAGTPTVVLDSADPHIMSLARDSKGNLYAGSNKSGLIYRIDRLGTSKVIYDASEQEIRALAVDSEDRLYFATADVTAGRAPSRGPMGISAARVVTSPPTGAEKGEPSTGPPPRPVPRPAPIRDEVSATNAVYRISPDGSVVQLYSVRGKMILSLLWTDGKLYAGTGNRGDLIQIDENLDVAVLEKDLEKQVLSLVAGAKGEILMGTADAGRVIRYAAGYVRDGLYTSEVFDAKFAARFGAVTWHGHFPAGTQVELITQTGNVAEPDASWSEWSVPLRVSGQVVASPGARFIRYRMRLKTTRPDAAPTVDDIKVAYLTSNQPPRLKSVNVTTPGERNKTAKKPTGPAQVDVSWQAEDPNGDKMRYSVAFRGRGDTNWRELETKTDKTSYTWKTDAVPDGTYEIRVEVSDEPDNPKSAALAHVRVSQPFLVDNTRPTVAVAARPGMPGTGKATLDVTMTDAAGIIKSAEYSVDSGEWQALLPDDRIFDSRVEKATMAPPAEPSS